VQALPPDYAAFLYVFEGEVTVGDEAQPVRTHELAVLSEGAQIRLRGSSSAPARAILVAGRPLKEPVAKYGPFVMNTREELQQAFVDFQNGRFRGRCAEGATATRWHLSCVRAQSPRS